MSLTYNEDFRRSGNNLISCHNPLVLDVTLQNTNTSAVSGDVTVDIAGTGDDTNTYVFDMAYVGSASAGGSNYDHTFRLDITDIIRRICNEPDLRNETASYYKRPSRLATNIMCLFKSSGESNTSFTNTYMHGFNQVNDPDSSCLVDFAEGGQAAGTVPGKYSIVPGVPMLLCFYAHTSITSPVVYLEGSSGVVGSFSPSSTGAGLWQLYHPTELGSDLYADMGLRPAEYDLYMDGSAEAGRVKLVALKKACEGDVILSWLNRYGVYSYMAFERYPILKREQKHIGSYDIPIYDLADVKSRMKSRGYQEARTVISAVAKNVPIEYLEIIEDLFYSMDVYYYTGTIPKYTYDDNEWTRVLVDGSINERRKYAYENVRIDITLPDKYTQLR
jgi:hypothetical protein